MTDISTGTATDVPEFPMTRAAGCPFAPPPKVLELNDTKQLSRVRIWDGSTPWLIHGYDAIRALFTDSRTSVDDRLPGYPHWNEGMLATVHKRPRSVFTSDAEEHTRFRRMLSKPFTFKRVEGLRPAVQKIADDRVDALLAGPKPGDIVSTLALPIPSLVISEMLGVPYEDADFFQEQAQRGTGRYATEEDTAQGAASLAKYLANLIRAKMHSPSEDLVSDLAERVNAEEISVREATAAGPRRADRRSRDHRQHDQPEHRGPARASRPVGADPRRRGSQGHRQRGRGADAVSEHHPDRSASHRRRGHRSRRRDDPGRRGHHPRRRAGELGSPPIPRPGPAGLAAARTARMSGSATAATNAWDSSWPAWNYRSLCPRCSAASQRCGWRCRSRSFRSSTTRWPTASTSFPSHGETRSGAGSAGPVRQIRRRDRCQQRSGLLPGEKPGAPSRCLQYWTCIANPCPPSPARRYPAHGSGRRSKRPGSPYPTCQSS